MRTEKFVSNAAWSLIGQLLPIFLAVICVPLLIKYIGVERFGFLSLAWILVGYAGLFDFGVSRAMTRIVANHLANNERDAAIHAAKVATTLMGGFGFCIGAITFLAAEPITEKWLNIPPNLLQESINSLRILALSIPTVLLTAAYRGALEATHAFKPLNIIRVVMGIFTYIAPLLAAIINPRLELVIGSVVLMRIAATYLHARVCSDTFTKLAPWSHIDKATASRLFSIGGWMSVSNIISPLMSYMDRFILGGLVAVKLVAYYSTPFDMITRTLVLPYSVMAVLFPIMAGFANRPDAAQKTYSTTIRFLLASMLPVTVTAVILADPLLTLWLGTEFAQNGTPILQILAIGVLINTLAQAPANLIQSTGNPKWMAILHVIELPIFLVAIWWLTGQYGIIGTALSWAGRMALDSLVLFAIVGKKLSKTDMSRQWPVYCTLFITIALAPVLMHTTTSEKVFHWAVAMTLLAPFTWKIILSHEDRATILSMLKIRVRPSV